MPLTDSKIRSARAESRARRLTDGGGLYVEVRPSGAKVWRLQYLFGGKRRAATLGPYPEMSLADARFEREVAKRQLRSGQDPFPPKARREAPEPVEPKEDPALYRVLARNYVVLRQKEGMHHRTANKLIRQIEATVAALGDKRIDEIKALDIAEMLEPIFDAGKNETAHETRARVAQVFDYAAGLGFVEHNPARIVTAAIQKRKRGSFAAITDPVKVGGLMRDLWTQRDCSLEVRAGLLLSAYLFPRNEMLRGMRWDEIDFDRALWEVPAARMKGGRLPHLVPLPRQAVSILKGIRRVNGRYPLVLPGRSPCKTKILSDAAFNKALRDLGYSNKVHVHHGFRTTASTNLNEMGFNRDWIERQLGHVPDTSVRSTYNKALYLEGRTEMMQVYADWLDEQREKAQYRPGSGNANQWDPVN